MAAVRPAIRRPWYHHLIIWGYVFAPVVNIVLVSVFLQVPLTRVVERLFDGFGVIAGAWLVSAPLVGIGLYLLHRFSWYLFVAHSALILIDFLVKWLAVPGLLLETIPPLNNLLILAGNLALVGFIGYIIQRDFRSPYFQVLPRSWRTHRRVPIRHRVLVDGREAMIDDLSLGGCFVRNPATEEEALSLAAGDRPELTFHGYALDFSVQGEVMRETPDGYGIRFRSLRRPARRSIRRLIRSRYSLRYRVRTSGRWSRDDSAVAGVVRDLSATGCFLEAPIAEVRPGQSGWITIQVGPHRVEPSATVVWVNAQGDSEKPEGFGLRFRHRQKRLLALAKEHLGPLEQAR